MIPDTVEKMLDAIGAPAGGDDVDLALSSLQVVTLVEELERTFGFALDGRDVTREHFATRRGLAALLAKKGVS